MNNIIKEFKVFFKEYFKLGKESFKNKKTWIPNLLTSSRLLGTFIIPPLLLSGNYPLLLLAITAFSLTDFLDGKIAKKTGGLSKFGSLLDPIVDKFFAVGLTLAIIPKMPILLINLIPEIFIAASNIKAFNNNINPKSSNLGRFKTWFLFSAVGLAYINVGLSSQVINIIASLLSIITCTIQTYTAYDYHKKYKEEENKPTHNNDQSDIKSITNETITNNFSSKKTLETSSAKELLELKNLLSTVNNENIENTPISFSQKTKKKIKNH